MRTTADISPFDRLWNTLPTTHSHLGGLVGDCTYSEQTKSRIINSTECAAAAEFLTLKAAVTALMEHLSPKLIAACMEYSWANEMKPERT